MLRKLSKVSQVSQERSPKSEFLDKFVDKDVIVVYREGGKERGIPAFFEGHDENFLFLRTDTSTLAISIDDVLKIKLKEENNREVS